MKMKMEYLVLAAIIICLSLYLVFQQSDDVGYSLPDISDIDKKDISKLEINIPSEEPLTLHKNDNTDNTWMIASKEQIVLAADSEKVESMLDVIDELTLTALVSESENYSRYDLGDDKKINVNAWAKDTLIRSFDIGKAASTFRHTFVRIGEDKRVYHAQENFRSKFDLSIEKLRDKTVLSFNETDIQKLSVVNKEKMSVLAMSQIPVEVGTDSGKKKNEEEEMTPETQPVWQDQDGNQAEKSKVDKLLSTLSRLTCESYITGKEKKDFADMKPIYIITLTGPEEYSLTLFEKVDKDATGYPAFSSHNEYPFMLAGFKAENIMKGLEDKTDLK